MRQTALNQDNLSITHNNPLFSSIRCLIQYQNLFQFYPIYNIYILYLFVCVFLKPKFDLLFCFVYTPKKINPHLDCVRLSTF